MDIQIQCRTEALDQGDSTRMGGALVEPGFLDQVSGQPLVPPPTTSGKGLLERVEDALLPLINLVFLLLMFFIVAGQLANDPLPELPGTGEAQENRAPEADLMVQADGQWKVDGEFLEGEQLLARLPAPALFQHHRNYINSPFWSYY